MTPDEIRTILAITQAEEIERLRAALVAIRKLNTAEPGGPDQVWVHSGLIAQEIFAALKEPKP